LALEEERIQALSPEPERPFLAVKGHRSSSSRCNFKVQKGTFLKLQQVYFQAFI